jgi:hypothetical protein
MTIRVVIFMWKDARLPMNMTYPFSLGSFIFSNPKQHLYWS